MECGFTEKISSLIDGELPPAEAREVERHLLTCVQCEEARVDFLNFRSQIASFEASLPAGRPERRAPVLRGSWGWNWGSGAVALASIAIVALIVGALMVRSIFYQKPEQVAFQSPPPVPAATVDPTPEVKPSPEAPRRQPTTPKRSAPPGREPKPGEQFAASPQNVHSADAQTMTAFHFEKAETLLRAFRNVRLNEPDSATEVIYERKRARQLVYQNMMLRREADAAGDVQIASLLESLEPILLDIANLPDKPDDDAVRTIRERVERKNIVALLQVNSTALARALD